MEQENNLRVCERCFWAICSREGDIEHKVVYVDEEDEEQSKCEWCENSGHYKLYELI